MLTVIRLTSEGRDALVDLVVQVAGFPGVAAQIMKLEGRIRSLEDITDLLAFLRLTAMRGY